MSVIEMKAIAVDDQQLSLDILELQLKSLDYFDEVACFTDPSDAVEYIKKHPVDIAFLDIMMDKIDGITLAGAIKTFVPSCHVIFTTASEDHALDAFKIHASGYLLKPVTKESVREQLDALFALQAPKPQPAVPAKCLYVQCFGNFEVFDASMNPLSFHYKKSKELLAYLVHREGAVCSNAELASVLYEDRDDSDSLQSQIRNLVSDLNKTLRAANASAALYKERGGVAVLPKEIDCDYYDYLEDKSSVTFRGEYMSQYDWSEVVNAYLGRQ